MSEFFPIVYSVKPSIRWMIPLYTEEISRIIFAMLKIVQKTNEISLISSQKLLIEIIFVTDAEISHINEESMGCSGPTNILSFPCSSSCTETQREPKQFYVTEHSIHKRMIPELGTLVFAPKTFMRECFLYGQEPKEHFIRLLAHGIAHLLGYDHSKEMDSLCWRMEQEASDITL